LSLRRICDSERSQEHRTTKSDRLDIWPRAALQFSIERKTWNGIMVYQRFGLLLRSGCGSYTTKVSR